MIVSLRRCLLILSAAGVGYFAIVADELNLWLHPLPNVESAAQDRAPPAQLLSRDHRSSASSDLTKGPKEFMRAVPHLATGPKLASQGLQDGKTGPEAQSITRSAADFALHFSEMDVLQVQEASGASRPFVEEAADPLATADRELARRMKGPVLVTIGEMWGNARTRLGQFADWYFAVRDAAELQVRGYLTYSLGTTSGDPAGDLLPLQIAEENRPTADSQLGAVHVVKDATEFSKQDTGESSEYVRSVIFGPPAIEASHGDKTAADGAPNGNSDELSKGETRDARDRSQDGSPLADRVVAENHEASASSDVSTESAEEKSVAAQRTPSARELKMKRRAERRMRREARKHELDRLARVTLAATRRATKQSEARPLERQVGAVYPVKDTTEFAKKDNDESTEHVRSVTLGQPAIEASHGDATADRERMGRMSHSDLVSKIGEVWRRARPRFGQIAHWYSAVRDAAELQVRSFLIGLLGRTNVDTSRGLLPLHVPEENRPTADSQLGAVPVVKDATEIAKRGTDENSHDVRSVTLGQSAIEAGHADNNAVERARNGNSDEFGIGKSADSQDRLRAGSLQAAHGVAENHEANVGLDVSTESAEEKSVAAQRTLSARELKMQRRAERRMHREARKAERRMRREARKYELAMARVTHTTTRQAQKRSVAGPLERRPTREDLLDEGE